METCAFVHFHFDSLCERFEGRNEGDGVNGQWVDVHSHHKKRQEMRTQHHVVDIHQEQRSCATNIIVCCFVVNGKKTPLMDSLCVYCLVLQHKSSSVSVVFVLNPSSNFFVPMSPILLSVGLFKS